MTARSVTATNKGQHYTSPSGLLVDNEKFCPNRRGGAVSFGIVCDLVAHACRKNELSAIRQFGMQFAFEAKQDMAFDTPMIGEITGRVLNQANTDIPEMSGSPVRQAAFAFVLGLVNRRPVGNAEWDVGHLHGTPSVKGFVMTSSPERLPSQPARVLSNPSRA